MTARKITQNNSNIEKKIPAIGVIINVIKIFHGIDVVAFSKEKLFKQSLFTSSVFFVVLYFVMPNYFQIFNET